MKEILRKIKWKLQNNRFELSWHAEEEKQADKITYSEIDEAIENLDIIEYSPDDLRGKSCLALGFTYEKKPLHFVLGNLENKKVLIVTMYRPKEGKWSNFRTRRKI